MQIEDVYSCIIRMKQSKLKGGVSCILKYDADINFNRSRR